MSNKVIITIDDSLKDTLQYCNVVQSNELGVVLSNHNMNLDDLIYILQDSIEVIEEKKPPKKRVFSTPVLPQNCIKHVTFWNEEQPEIRDEFILLEVPKQRWDIYVYDHLIKDVGFPRLLFGYLVQNNTVRSLNVMAVKNEGPILDSTEIFVLPFPNIGVNGGVCMGSTKFPQIKRLKSLETMHNLFFAAPFNSDYFDAGKSLAGITTFREFANYLAGKDFPDEILVSTKQPLEMFYSDLFSQYQK